MPKAIPIENIYYLLCYAWDRLEEADLVSVQVEQCETLQDLFAKVLTNGAQRLIRRGFHRNYQEHTEEIGSLRGRILFPQSIRRLSWASGRMTCEFTELSYNTIPNRILKTTLRNLLHCRGISGQHKEEMAGVLHQLHEVDSIRITATLFRRIQYHQNLRPYRFLMQVCEFIHEQLIPSERAGESLFWDFLRDERQMAALFEAFIFKFYRLKSPFAVSRRIYAWEGFEGAEASQRMLPQMKTDVELRTENRLIILDCKYYQQALSLGYHSDSGKFRSENLYQLHAYLQNAKLRAQREGEALDAICGMLLYPAVNETFCHEFKLQSHPMRICTVNLNQPWQSLETELLERVECWL